LEKTFPVVFWVAPGRYVLERKEPRNEKNPELFEIRRNFRVEKGQQKKIEPEPVAYEGKK